MPFMTKHTRSIDKAIAAAGTQAELARVLEISRPSVNRVFLSKLGKVPPAWCLKLHDLYGLRLHDLRPDIYPPDFGQAA